jgi:hypothetical protein
MPKAGSARTARGKMIPPRARCEAEFSRLRSGKVCWRQAREALHRGCRSCEMTCVITTRRGRLRSRRGISRLGRTTGSAIRRFASRSRLLGARIFAISTDHSLCRSRGCETLAAFEAFIELFGQFKYRKVRDDESNLLLRFRGFNLLSSVLEVPECMSCYTVNIIFGKPESCTCVEALQITPTSMQGISCELRSRHGTDEHSPSAPSLDLSRQRGSLCIGNGHPNTGYRSRCLYRR